ncbi:hypothetical protein [Legionella taurinensis]|uniref:hypothetical protein n=1 Tax=Legionella taurinensis TaxID=70611 RepID=UPI000DFDBF4E|nr:hypothetical protein [Legionella taurinensis]STY25409.1 Uncharacterised protein [Legionella taurinensis]
MLYRFLLRYFQAKLLGRLLAAFLKNKSLKSMPLSRMGILYFLFNHFFRQAKPLNRK